MHILEIFKEIFENSNTFKIIGWEQYFDNKHSNKEVEEKITTAYALQHNNTFQNKLETTVADLGITHNSKLRIGLAEYLGVSDQFKNTIEALGIPDGKYNNFQQFFNSLNNNTKNLISKSKLEAEWFLPIRNLITENILIIPGRTINVGIEKPLINILEKNEVNNFYIRNRIPDELASTYLSLKISPETTPERIIKWIQENRSDLNQILNPKRKKKNKNLERKTFIIGALSYHFVNKLSPDWTAKQKIIENIDTKGCFLWEVDNINYPASLEEIDPQNNMPQSYKAIKDLINWYTPVN